mgnify:FL=1
MEVFDYDEQLTYNENFNKWRLMNKDEREIYGERPLAHGEAERMFAKMAGDLWLKKKRN